MNDQETSPVSSHTEWDPLEEVIVGRPEGASASFWDPMDRYVYTDKERAEIEQDLKLYQPYPSEYITQARAAIDRFTHILEAEGVIVRQVADMEYVEPFGTPDWQTSSGFCAANPRDPFMVVGDQIIEAPMCSRSRYFEARAYHELFDEYARQGARWVAAPRPLLRDELFNPQFDEPDSPTRYGLTEVEPVFDAADFVRCGRDIFGILSHLTNRAGVEWLQRHLGDEYKVHLLESRDPKPAHIDTSLVLLAPGKVLVNPEFIDVGTLPSMFRSWDVLIAPEPVPYRTRPRLVSNWISINTLMLDEQRIVVEQRQEPLIRKLEEWGFQPIPCDFEAYYRFIGGFHCATLDVRRQGELKSYF